MPTAFDPHLYLNMALLVLQKQNQMDFLLFPPDFNGNALQNTIIDIFPDIKLNESKFRSFSMLKQHFSVCQ